jgi:peptidoglycan/xylan/chitin deacetylase (PgdA/CDA1 family)
MGLLTGLYYLLKPALPRQVRYSIRRLRAHYKLASTANWPVMESAGQKPPGWKGWPGGKEFAVVLTHDVEGMIGLERTLRLAALEKRLGFRSAFNFIPEGEYRVPDELRRELVASGFEVGVHDLHHDGSLYRSRKAFEAASTRINHYLKEWDAVGFRAGFMFHNLEWLKSLDIEYDASTFDTDPFEPQPDGVSTIFPFWVPGNQPGTGYVELPYTLPQDSTLFLIFRDDASDLWKRKLDWVAAHGGMALLNVHPDYLAFDQPASGPGEFPVEFYEQFLTYVWEKYAGTYWHGLPRDLARYIRAQHT